MRYTVYKTTNTLNGKIYIGAHRTLNPRDRYLGSGRLISEAIRKYGREAFVKRVLFDFDTLEEMFAKEAELVPQAFVDRPDTYNLIPGGTHGNRYYQALKGLTPEVRRVAGERGMATLQRLKAEDPLLREYCNRASGEVLRRWNRTRSKESLATFRGRTHSKGTKAKMSEALKVAQKGERNSQYGTVWVCREGDAPRKIPKVELPAHQKDGWKRGRKP